MSTFWDDSAHSALMRIYENIRKKPRASLQQLRTDLDDFIDELFHSSTGYDKATIRWAVIGADALEVAIQRGEPFEMPEVLQVLVRKQRDYGHENIRRFGRQGLMVRMHDKVARLENLLTTDGGGKPNNESIRDNILDVVGYAAIGIMWENQQFLLPLKPQ